MKFEGYKVIITGATSGIGLAAAEEFITDGATVIGIGRNFSRTEKLGEKFIPFKCDVTEESQIQDAVNYAAQRYGMIDTLICNAGAGVLGTVENVGSDQMDYAYKLLLRPSVLFTKYCVPLLRKSKNPSIIHTASIASYMIGDAVPYNVFKAALLNYSRQSAAALLNANKTDASGKPRQVSELEEGDNPYIRVNAICPGLIRTSIMDDKTWDILSAPEMLNDIPSRRIGEAWEPAKLIAYLASEKAKFITGAAVTIDGGWWTTHPRV